jgi:type IX secretion system PorP/SprF family membrane protein
MNRLILSIFVLFYPVLLSGQMFPLSDHYVVNALAINPAYAGCQDALSLTASSRNQWVGFKDAPKSYILSLHTPVFNDRVGLGLLIENNSFGIFKETSLYGNYAYRMEIQEGKLALGLGFGVTLHNAAWNELIARDENDAELLNTNTSSVIPNFSLGVYYYTKSYYFGLSLPMFLSHEMNNKTGKYNTGYNFSGSNYFLSGGYEVKLSPVVKLLPSMLIKYHPKNPVQIDINAQIDLKDRIWMGIGYRNKNILVAMLQCQLNYQIRIAYSYDYTFGSIGKYMNGSHEIVLNYVFKYSRKVTGPRQF